uniref:J domain-containing protein n=1 Tax=Opuntia streptacantha TaxID=393608 RepID=A0A7C9E752_OPUST
MECNKEEASRAKAIAERKMQDKDFVGAHKFASKAQQLYPDTENIAQMICVCNVHRSAENKILGNDLDWYSILQIEHTADDGPIKKQYRKLALLLHPDKNKFPGAESAFKLITEAQKVLLDRDKRLCFDMKRRIACKPVIQNQASQQTSRGFNAAQHSRCHSNFMSNPGAPFQEPKQQVQQSGPANGRETFWTLCPFCSVRYQYYKEVLNRSLRCQNCKKTFVAYNMHDQATRPGPDTTRPVFPRQDGSNVQVREAWSEAVNRKPTPNSGTQAAENAEFSKSKNAKQSLKGSDNMRRDSEEGSKPSGKANGVRERKQMVESSESFESDNSLDSEEMRSDGDNLRAQQFDNVGDHHTRRTSRNKRLVSYSENARDDDKTMSPLKRAKGSGPPSPLTEEKSDALGKEQPCKISSPASASINEGRKGACNNSDDVQAFVEPTKKRSEPQNGFVVESSPETTPEPTFHEYPDPEFCDFDKDREENCFKVGQVWAAYDTVDAMPRFYARIRKVFSPGFKLQITWLEPDPVDEDGILWAESELPLSCGKFKFGNSDYTEDRPMFSHLVSWEKGSSRDSVKIYPRKGETWALFKNWDAKWYEISEKERKYEYEFVEVLSEYDDTVGIRVAHLVKLKGFASLFCQIGDNEIQIPPAEVLRFSHKVPSYRMTGDERNYVPKGSFELDPASITMKLEEVSLLELDGHTPGNDLPNPAAKASVETAKNSASNNCDNEVEHVNQHDVAINGLEVPDSEFFYFDGTRSDDKFQVNQVWALYSDIDGLPKYYGLIKKIDPHPGFKLHIAWLEACYLARDMVLWKDKHMPISCGQFKVKGGRGQQYTSSSSFSHQLQAGQTGRKGVFAIYPRKGEVWAIYKKWHPDMNSSCLKNCEYDIVEVLEENPFYVEVSFLERVHGFKSVFKPQKSGDSSLTKEIPLVELLRFSHRIPSFRLTDEKDGSLRGYWELDPAALPAHILYGLK